MHLVCCTGVGFIVREVGSVEAVTVALVSLGCWNVCRGFLLRRHALKICNATNTVMAKQAVDHHFLNRGFC